MSVTAADMRVTTAEDESVTADFDVKGPSGLLIRVAAKPDHGAVKLGDSSFTYTPTPDFNGADSFVYEVSWPGGKAKATVKLTVTPVNDAPTMTGVSITPSAIRTGMVVTAQAAGFADIDGDPEGYRFTWIVNGVALAGTGPVLGDVNVVKGNTLQVIATPYDGAAEGEPVQSDVITVLNTAPVANAVTLAGNEDAGPFSGDLPGSDADTADLLTYAAVASDATGTLSLDSAGHFTWQPAPNWNGAYHFSYQVSDGAEWSYSGEVTITVTPINDAPALTSVSITPATIRVGSVVTAVPTGFSDIDGDPAAYHYSWIVNGVEVTDTTATLAAVHVVKGNTLQAVAKPYDGLTEGAPVSSAVVTVRNTAPVAPAVIRSVNEDGGPFTGTLPGYDADVTDTVTYAQVASDATGVLALDTAGHYAWQPNENWNGAYHFAYRVSDGTEWSYTAGVTITVLPVNDPPAITGVTLSETSLLHGTAVTVIPSGASDVDGDPVSYVYRWTVNGASVAVSSATLPGSYVTKGKIIRGYVKPFDGAALGGELASAPLTVGNTPPVAVTLNRSTDEDTADNGTFTAADVDTIDTLSYEVVTAPAHGTVSLGSGAAFSYTPAMNYNGSDSFAYRVSDGTAWSNLASVNETVSAVNDAPYFVTVTGSTQLVDPNAVVTIEAAAADVENDAITMQLLDNATVVATGSPMSVTAPGTTGTQKMYTLRIFDGEKASVSFVYLRTKGPRVSSLASTPGTLANTWLFSTVTTSYSLSPVANVWWRVGGSWSALDDAALTWPAPGVPGVYEIALRVTDVAGYTGYFTTAVAVTTPTQWAQIGNDRQQTSRKGYAEGLASVLEAPGVPTGAVKWAAYTGQQNWYPALSTGGTLDIMTNQGLFWAVATTNQSVKSADIGWAFLHKPAISTTGTVYIGGAFYSQVYAKNAETLAAIRSINGQGGAHSSPVIANDGTIYTGNDHKVRALQPNLDESWAYGEGPSFSHGMAIAADGTIYAVANFNTVYALYPTGTTHWTYTTTSTYMGDPAIAADGTIYITGQNPHKLFAINPDGTEKWTITTPTYAYNLVIGADGTLYVRGNNGPRAYTSAGTFKWEFNAGGLATEPAIGADGTLYFGCNNGKFYAITPDGVEKWHYTGTAAFNGTVIGPDGTVYAASSDGYVYAFQ